ncbi:hypothetical protein LK08_14900 [Streptomyces sp. MUSC 125]|uniref:TniQ family protein n=1 Tax=Streptomyces sp. MUSC 125 TaxID=1428624 RepID=UPI000583507F|nr:TniQ family protein [Streptomyces sp. MUSC 125]KIE26463.1 hypothetical protein LK08_14900 [Streptomyces sp. MUSC 125]
MLPRRLALVTAPQAGEAFGSWPDRMAWFNRCPPGVMAELFGLGLRGPSADLRPRTFGVRANDAVCDAVYAAADVTALATERMHLTVFDQGPLVLSEVLAAGDTAARATAGSGWVEVYGSRTCPLCLLSSGGVWPLWWKLACAGVCPVHEVVLLDRCPSCRCVLRWGGMRPRVLSNASRRAPMSCASMVGRRPCPQWLPMVRARSAPPGVAGLQQRWLEIACGRVRPVLGGVEVSRAEWFAAYRACVVLVRLGLPGVLGRLRGAPAWWRRVLMGEREVRGLSRARFGWGPASAEAATVFLAVVMPVLEAANARELGQCLMPLVRAAADAGGLGAKPLSQVAVPAVFARAVATQMPVNRRMPSPW